MMLHVAFLGVLSSAMAEPIVKRLATPCDIVHIDMDDSVAAMPDIDVLVSAIFTKQMGAAAKRLKLIQVAGAGLDRIDRQAIPRGAVLANVFGHESGIAEYVFGAMIALSRDFTRVDAKFRKGEWVSHWVPGNTPPVWRELGGRTMGILGYGHIGKAVARLAQAFGMEVLAIRRDTAQPDAHASIFGMDRLGEVLQRSDFLVLTLPLNPQTKDLLGAKELKSMKPTSILINVARGGIVDEAALYQALAKGTIAGAALDVWYRYPTEGRGTIPANQPLHELNNVLMTPHVSAWTDGMLEARPKVVAENIRRVEKGEPLLNVVA